MNLINTKTNKNKGLNHRPIHNLKKREGGKGRKVNTGIIRRKNEIKDKKDIKIKKKDIRIKIKRVIPGRWWSRTSQSAPQQVHENN